MGAYYDYFVSSAKNVSDVKKEFDKYCQQAAYDDGHSYSGRLNMCDGLEFVFDVAPDVTKAHALLNGQLEKWGPAKAIQFKVGKKMKWLIAGICSS